MPRSAWMRESGRSSGGEGVCRRHILVPLQTRASHARPRNPGGAFSSVTSLVLAGRCMRAVELVGMDVYREVSIATKKPVSLVTSLTRNMQEPAMQCSSGTVRFRRSANDAMPKQGRWENTSKSHQTGGN